MNKKPLMLMILDGWGINPCDNQINAIKNAAPKEYLELLSKYPHSQLKASGEAVGLPEGQMGNSEVGHLNIGAGRVIYQPLVKITKDIRDGEFFEIPVLKEAFEYTKENNTAIHFAGLVSDGGVHSHIDHIYGLLQMAKNYGLTKVYLHAFLDGRDTPPASAVNFLAQVEAKMAEIGVGKIATISGRYYAMDRDKNYDRTKIAYDNMTLGNGIEASSADEAIKASYAAGVTDEFVKPTVIDKEGLVKSGDVLVNFNFRPDRARQITRAFNDKEFTFFDRNIDPIKVYCMRQYDSTIDAPVIYKDDEIVNTFGEVISKAGLTQLRTAETEKYAHVTFFFNGGVESQYPGEDRKLVASPKVATYDLKPEMSAYEVKDKLIAELDKDIHDVVIVNFANCDMVGHTGSLPATIIGVESVDLELARVIESVNKVNGILLVTADHGNADDESKTSHTLAPVPFIVYNAECELKEGEDLGLSNVAATVCDFLGLEPNEHWNPSLKK